MILIVAGLLMSTGTLAAPSTGDVRWFLNAAKYESARGFVATVFKNGVLSLTDLDSDQLDRFDSVFVPGGHATMEQYPTNAAMGRILLYFHQNAKPTALICHGPAALIGAI